MELTHARARAHAARRGWETYLRAVDVPLEAGLRRPLRLTRHHLEGALVGAALGQAGDHRLPCRETAVCQRPGLCGTSSFGRKGTQAVCASLGPTLRDLSRSWRRRLPGKDVSREQGGNSC